MQSQSSVAPNYEPVIAKIRSPRREGHGVDHVLNRASDADAPREGVQLERFDVVDILETDDPKQIEKAAMIIRAYGHSTTETLAGNP